MELNAINPNEKTFIVIGATRGGTSMVAGVLHHLGVNMVSTLPSTVYERLDLSLAIEGDTADEANNIIASLNTQYKIWGWKRPDSIYHTEKWQDKFRNPHYIFVFRDLFVIANRNRISMLHDVIDNIQTANEHYRLMTEFLKKTKAPTLLISYEKAIMNQQYFVENMSKFVGSKQSKEMIENALKFIQTDNQEYLEESRFTNTVGHFDEVTAEHIKGCAFYFGNTELAVKVKIEINQKDVFYANANEFRADINDSGMHPTGICGFTFKFPEGYQLKSGSKISLRGYGDIKDISNSPSVYETELRV